MECGVKRRYGSEEFQTKGVVRGRELRWPLFATRHPRSAAGPTPSQSFPLAPAPGFETCAEISAARRIAQNSGRQQKDSLGYDPV